VTAASVRAEPSLEDVLALEEIDRDIYRSNLVYPDRWALYGGQVAAQGLLAAGRTVGEGRVPHSLHCYFLRPGDAERPTVFRVDRDRDGRSFSARRVVAIQGGEVVCSMSCSFAAATLDGPDRQNTAAPAADPPETRPTMTLPRLFQMDCRLPEQPYPGASWPTRLWARTSVPLPDDPLVHAAVLTYFSDIASGTSAFEGSAERTATSLDHAVWFHRPMRMDDWVLMDLVPHTMAGARGWYTGTVHDAAGRLGASLTQEILARPRTPRATDPAS
jgi:acyl-CoA thioesterase-2